MDESKAYIPTTAFKDKLFMAHTYERDKKAHREKRPKKQKPKHPSAMIGIGAPVDEESKRSGYGSDSASSSDASVNINAILENRQKPEEGKKGEEY